MAISLGDLIFEIGLEDGKFQQGLKAANAKMDSFAKTAKDTGGKLTKGITLPITALGAASLKLAADFEVSSKKFSKAFEGAGDEAAKSVKRLNEEYGIATSQGTELLAFTGDLLKGFGASSAEALKLAESTNILSAALGAYNGVPVAEASKAITSALTGERDALKSLGIVISEEAVKRQLAIDGTEDLTGQALLLAKGQATLTLAYQQSADAVTSFSENTGTASFQMSTLLADVKDLGVEFGTLLLPVLKDGIEIIKDIVEDFSALSEEQKETAIKTAALVAALGPALTVVGNITTAVSGLSKAFTVLAANPALLGVAVSIAAIGTGIAVINEKLKETAPLAEITKRLAEGTATYADKLSVVNTQLELETAKALKQREVYNTNRGKAAENAKKKLLEIETVIFGINRTIKAIEKERDTELDAIKAELKAEEAAQAKKKALADAEAEAIEKKRQAQEDLIAKYVAQNDLVQEIIESNKTEIEQIDDQIVAISELSLKEGELQDDRLEAIGILEARKEAVITRDLEIAEAEQEAVEKAEKAKLDTRIDFEEQWNEKLLEQKDDKEALLELEYDSAIEKAEMLGADTLSIETYYDEERIRLAEETAEILAQLEEDKTAEEDAARELRLQKERAYFTTIAGLAANTIGDIGSIYKGLTQIKLNLLETETQAQIAELDQSVLSEEEYAAEVTRIKNEQAMEEYEIKLEAFKSQKSIDIAQTVIQTSVNAVQAYGALAGIPVIGPALGAAAAIAAIALGAVQIGLIQSEPEPVRPQLALGGIVNPTASGTDVTIGEAGSPEAVIPLNDRFFNKLASAATGTTLGNVGKGKGNISGATSINLILDGEVVAKSTVDIINNKIYTIDPRSIR